MFTRADKMRIFSFILTAPCFSGMSGQTKAAGTGTKLWSSVMAGLLLLFAIPANANPVVFTYTGQVTDDAINGCGGLVNCGVVTGSYTFDSAAADFNPDLAEGLYSATNIELSIDGLLFFSSASGLINVANFSTVDQYGLLSTGVATNGSEATLSILLADSTATAFSSDALPLNASALAPLLPGTFQLNAGDDTFQLLGTIDSVSSGTTAPVPEPSSGMFLALGISILFARRGLLRLAGVDGIFSNLIRSRRK
jgi:hypothetical protein